MCPDMIPHIQGRKQRFNGSRGTRGSKGMDSERQSISKQIKLKILWSQISKTKQSDGSGWDLHCNIYCTQLLARHFRGNTGTDWSCIHAWDLQRQGASEVLLSQGTICFPLQARPLMSTLRVWASPQAHSALRLPGSAPTSRAARRVGNHSLMGFCSLLLLGGFPFHYFPHLTSKGFLRFVFFILFAFWYILRFIYACNYSIFLMDWSFYHYKISLSLVTFCLKVYFV